MRVTRNNFSILNIVAATFAALVAPALSDYTGAAGWESRGHTLRAVYAQRAVLLLNYSRLRR